MPRLSPDAATEVASFVDRTYESVVGACRLIVLPVAVDDVVSFAGAIRTSPDLASGDDILQQLTSLTLDKGTVRRDRFAIADLIDNRGAQLQFRSSSQRITFSGRALKDDIADVLGLAAEQLREPLFAATEVEKSRARLSAELKRSEESSGARASGALSRLIYPEGHPNYTRHSRESLKLVDSAGPEAVRAFYDAHVGSDQLTIVIVGDVEPNAIEAIVQRHFGDWQPKARVSSMLSTPDLEGAETIEDILPGKTNIDVRLGHAVPILRDDANFLPLHLGTFVLGGNFSARLMNIVRDRMGLTYGIGAALTGTSVDYSGHFRVAVTLSPEKFEEGVAATRAVIRDFVQDGATEAEVDAARETIRGSFLVDLATTGGLAYSLLVHHLRGFGTIYLDQFREEVGSISRDMVNAAVAAYLRPHMLHLSFSGAAPVHH